MTTTYAADTARIADLERQIASLRELVDRALDYAADLRGYTRDWDWKYGYEWDAELQTIVHWAGYPKDCLVAGSHYGALVQIDELTVYHNGSGRDD